jgi:hypothetical protein
LCFIAFHGHEQSIFCRNVELIDDAPAATPQSHDCICPSYMLGSGHVPECPWPNRPKE